MVLAPVGPMVVGSGGGAAGIYGSTARHSLAARRAAEPQRKYRTLTKKASSRAVETTLSFYSTNADTFGE
jgi:hypothetical protein